MLRIHCLQWWVDLSDPAVEEALYDSLAMRSFVGIDLGREPVPDETTVMRFRRLLERHKLGERIFETASGAVIERAVTLPRTGTKTVPVEFTVPTARLLDVLRRARGSDLSSLGYRLRGSASWGHTGIPLDFDRQGNLEVLRNFADLLRPLLAPR